MSKVPINNESVTSESILFSSLSMKSDRVEVLTLLLLNKFARLTLAGWFPSAGIVPL